MQERQLHAVNRTLLESSLQECCFSRDISILNTAMVSTLMTAAYHTHTPSDMWTTKREPWIKRRQCDKQLNAFDFPVAAICLTDVQTLCSPLVLRKTMISLSNIPSIFYQRWQLNLNDTADREAGVRVKCLSATSSSAGFRIIILHFINNTHVITFTYHKLESLGTSSQSVITSNWDML